MEDVSFFDAAVDQPYFGRISHICLENRRGGIPISPRTHGNIFGCISMIGMVIEREAVAHRLRAITDGSGTAWKTCMRINRLFTIFCIDFQLIVKKHSIFAECRFGRMINIRKQTAVQRLPCHRIKPGRTCCFDDNSKEREIKFAKSSIDFSNELTHNRTATQMDAELCYNAVLSTVHIIKVLNKYND